jgi:hypothetical protein
LADEIFCGSKVLAGYGDEPREAIEDLINEVRVTMEDMVEVVEDDTPRNVICQ